MRDNSYGLEDFEAYIVATARSFAKREADVDDFAQEGRLAAWQALQDDPTATKSYVKQRIKWRLLDYVQRKLYKNPEELSADYLHSNMLYSDYTIDE